MFWTNGRQTGGGSGCTADLRVGRPPVNGADRNPDKPRFRSGTRGTRRMHTGARLLDVHRSALGTGRLLGALPRRSRYITPLADT